jgi:hypothetical protein
VFSTNHPNSTIFYNTISANFSKESIHSLNHNFLAKGLLQNEQFLEFIVLVSLSEMFNLLNSVAIYYFRSLFYWKRKIFSGSKDNVE